MFKWFMEPKFSDGVVEFFGDGVGVVLLGFLKMLIIWIGLLLAVAVFAVAVFTICLAIWRIAVRLKTLPKKNPEPAQNILQEYLRETI